MNRRERRALRAKQHAFVKEFPTSLTPIPPEEFPQLKKLPWKAWKSRNYLVQLYTEDNADYPGLMRMSVCRTHWELNGRWDDGLTWDELQAIKHEIGLGSCYAVEVYPPDADVVNVANLRRLWILPIPLSIGF